MVLHELLELRMLFAELLAVEQVGIFAHLGGYIRMSSEEPVHLMPIVHAGVGAHFVPRRGIAVEVLLNVWMLRAPCGIVDLIRILLELATGVGMLAEPVLE